MTKIKLCGLSRPKDVEYANLLRPEYIGFVFAKGSRRRVSTEEAASLRRRLADGICAVGVFVNESADAVARLLDGGVIDMAQLHGDEDDGYIRALRSLTGKPLIKAFRVKGAEDVVKAEASAADLVLLDSGAGTGKGFDHSLVSGIKRPYFLAGGLDADSVGAAIKALDPFAVDVSSGIETDGRKDFGKMAAFVAAVRKGENT